MVSQLQYLNICNSWIYHYTQVTIIAPLWSKRNQSPRIPQTPQSARHIQPPARILSAALMHSRATSIPHQEAPSGRKPALGHPLRSNLMAWSSPTINARRLPGNQCEPPEQHPRRMLTVCLSVSARNSRPLQRPVGISQRPSINCTDT